MPGLIWSSKGGVLSGGAGVPDGTTDGQFLLWNAAAGEWQPQAVTPADIGAVSTDILMGTITTAPATIYNICDFTDGQKLLAVVSIDNDKRGIFILQNVGNSLGMSNFDGGNLFYNNGIGYWKIVGLNNKLKWDATTSHTLKYLVIRIGD